MPLVAKKRLIVVQGPAQLLSAMAALKEKETHETHGEWENHLLVGDLGLRGSADLPLRNWILEFGSQFLSWHSVVSIPETTLARWRKTRWLFLHTPRSLLDELRKTIAVCPDEIFLMRNFYAFPKWLCRAFPEARRICFGDAIGVYFTERYAKEVFSSSIGFMQIDRAVGRLVGRPALGFSEAYLIPDGSFQSPPAEKIFPLTRASIFGALDQFATLTNDRIWSETVERLPSHPWTLLLSTTLSENRRLSEADEIKAYLDFLRSRCQTRHLVIKPHPRENPLKLNRLTTSLTEAGYEVTLLSEENFRYLPAEVLLRRLKTHYGQSPQAILAVSSSAIPMAYLFPIPILLGFGEPNVEQRFPKATRYARLKHEGDLLKILSRQREQVT